MSYSIMVAQEFAAAHKINGYPGDCCNIHGHTWRVELLFTGDELDELGMLLDFRPTKKILAAVLDDLDHKLINDVPPFNSINPTAENLAYYVFARIKPHSAGNYRLQAVKVWESVNSCAAYSEEL